MKIKEFINELQKCNPEAEIFVESLVGFFAEIFVESLVGFFAVTGVVDYNGDGEIFIIENETFPIM